MSFIHAHAYALFTQRPAAQQARGSHTEPAAAREQRQIESLFKRIDVPRISNEGISMRSRSLTESIIFLLEEVLRRYIRTR